MESEFKVCKKCGFSKSLDEFNKHAACSQGVENRCRACAKQYREENKAKIDQKRRENYDPIKKKVINAKYREANLDKLRQYDLERRNSPEAKQERNKKQNEYHETFEGFITGRWNGINYRTINGSCPGFDNPRNKAYFDAGVEVRMTRDEFVNFCEENRQIIEFLLNHPVHVPSIDRISEVGDNRHYSIDNIRIITLSENIGKRNSSRKSSP